MKLIVEGDTIEELQADFKASMSVFGLPGTLDLAPEIPQPAPEKPVEISPLTTQSEPTPPATKVRKRRTKQMIEWDATHGVTLNVRKKMEVLKAENQELTDEQALAMVQGAPVPPAATVAPAPAVAPPAPVAPPVPTSGNGQGGPVATPPALTGHPPIPQTPPATAPVPATSPAPSVAPAGPAVEIPQLPPTPASGHGPATHANPAPGSPITDDMLRNAISNLAINVGNEAAAHMMNQLGVTQIADIALEYRQWCVEEVERQINSVSV